MRSGYLISRLIIGGAQEHVVSITKRGSPTWSGSLPDFRPGFGNSKHVTNIRGGQLTAALRHWYRPVNHKRDHRSGLVLTRACRKDWLECYHSDDRQQTSGQLNIEGATEP